MRTNQFSVFLILFAFAGCAHAGIINYTQVLNGVKPLLIDCAIGVAAVGGARLLLIVTIFGYKLIRRDYRPMPMWLIKDKKAWRDYHARHK